MKKLLFTLLGLLLSANVAWPQEGIFSRNLCTEILSPVTNKSFCFETTGAEAGTLKRWNGSAWVAISGGGGGGTITGSGTTNNVSKWTGSTALGNSLITDDGTTISFGNVATNALTHNTSAVTGQKTVTWPNVSGTVQVDGAVSFNTETAGNTLTSRSFIQLDFAACPDGATASLQWDRAGNSDTTPTATCNDTGNIQRPSADFSGSAVNTLERTIALPPDFTGAIDLVIRYVTTSASPTGNVEWDISTVCTSASWNATFNAAQTITDAVAAQNILNDATQTSVTITGCSAGSDLTLRISRDGVNDTNNDAAKALWARLTIRRAQ